MVERVHTTIKSMAARTDGWYFVPSGHLPNISQSNGRKPKFPNDWRASLLEIYNPKCSEQWQNGVLTKDGEGVTVEDIMKMHVADVRKNFPKAD